MRPKVLVLAAVSSIVFASIAQAQFINMTQYDNGTNLTYFVQQDINHDGIPDVVGIRNVTQVTAEITVLLGNGSGGFKAPVNTMISGVDNPLPFFRLGDFTSNGYADVVVFGTNHVTGQAAVAVMLSNGNGTFQAGVETTLAAGGPLNFCATNAGDYNGDGKVDLAYLSSNNAGIASLTVLPGKGDGTFSTSVVTTVGSFNGCMATGDFNNDKKLDIALSAGNLYMLLGKGNGSFDSPVLVGKGADTLEAADLNRDGNLDLAGISGGTVNVYLGDGTGHFPTTHTYTNSLLANAGAAYKAPFGVVDVNGDGYPDIEAIAVTGNDNRTISVLLNKGDGSFTSGNTYNADNGGSSESVLTIGNGLLVAALTDNGKVDLVSANGAGGVSVMLGNGNGTFQGNTMAGNGAAKTGGNEIQAADFNGDHNADLITDLNRQVLLGNGKGEFTAVNSGCNYSVEGTDGDDAIGVFTKDGKLDIATASGIDGVGAVGVCLGNGNGTFTTGGGFDQGVQHGEVLTGDFNNDGILDLAASDEGGVSILLGNGDGTFQNGIPTAVDASFPNFAVGDFNNDGKLDIAAVTRAGIAVFLGNGNGTFKAPIISAVSTPFFPKGVDLNKDGKLDLVIAGPGGPITVMLGKGDGTFEAPIRYSLPSGAITQAVIGDFNRDGHPDVAVGTFDSGIAIFFGDGTGKLSATPALFSVGSQVAGLAAADFNGDGKPDLAAVVGANNYIVILLNQ